MKLNRLHSEATGVAYTPAGLLQNPHVQSILGSLPLRRRIVRRRATQVLARAERVELVVLDDVRLEGYLTRSEGVSRGLIIFLHGWEGSADSNYVLSSSYPLLSKGFDIFRLNFRDHGDTHHMNEELFHSCRLDEVAAAVERAAEAYGSGPVYLVGFSLGGNFALRVAAAKPGVVAEVFAFCPVLRPMSTMRALEEGPWFYRKYFLGKWRRSLSRKAACFPELYDFGDLERFPDLTSTTRHFVEAYTEYPTLEDYLEGYAITGTALVGLETPAQLVVAADDPVIPVQDLRQVARPRPLQIRVSRYGGHCGFIHSAKLTSWVDHELARALGAG